MCLALQCERQDSVLINMSGTANVSSNVLIMGHVYKFSPRLEKTRNQAQTDPYLHKLSGQYATKVYQRILFSVKNFDGDQRDSSMKVKIIP